jgi:predicted LPLAT superfamily acyltransferase
MDEPRRTWRSATSRPGTGCLSHPGDGSPERSRDISVSVVNRFCMAFFVCARRVLSSHKRRLDRVTQEPAGARRAAGESAIFSTAIHTSVYVWRGHLLKAGTVLQTAQLPPPAAHRRGRGRRHGANL